MKHQRALGALVIAITLGITACGSGEQATTDTATKTIEVTMTDNEFTPNSFDVTTGQKVTFRFVNDGKVDHEAILGSESVQADHETQMMDNGTGHGGMDGMGGGGTSSTEAITVKPGRTGTLARTFTTAGTVILGCHEPGHYASGMKATITVS